MVIKKRIEYVTDGTVTYFLHGNTETGRVSLVRMSSKRSAAEELRSFVLHFPTTTVREPELVVPRRLVRRDRLQEIRNFEDKIVGYLHQYGSGRWFAYFNSPAFLLVPWLEALPSLGYTVEDVDSLGRVFA